MHRETAPPIELCLAWTRPTGSLPILEIEHRVVSKLIVKASDFIPLRGGENRPLNHIVYMLRIVLYLHFRLSFACYCISHQDAPNSIIIGIQSGHQFRVGQVIEALDSLRLRSSKAAWLAMKMD